MFMKLYEVTFGMRLYFGVRLFMGKYSSLLQYTTCHINNLPRKTKYQTCIFGPEKDLDKNCVFKPCFKNYMSIRTQKVFLQKTRTIKSNPKCGCKTRTQISDQNSIGPKWTCPPGQKQSIPIWAWNILDFFFWHPARYHLSTRNDPQLLHSEQACHEYGELEGKL